jgi:hypothetical protein
MLLQVVPKLAPPACTQHGSTTALLMHKLSTCTTRIGGATDCTHCGKLPVCRLHTVLHVCSTDRRIKSLTDRYLHDGSEVVCLFTLLCIIKLHFANQVIVQQQQIYLGAKTAPPDKSGRALQLPRDYAGCGGFTTCTGHGGNSSKRLLKAAPHKLASRFQTITTAVGFQSLLCSAPQPTFAVLVFRPVQDTCWPVVKHHYSHYLLQ